MKESTTDCTDRADRSDPEKAGRAFTTGSPASGEQATGNTSAFAKASADTGPKLSDEQREWLNTVFIPNFRAELMREMEDLTRKRRGAGTQSQRQEQGRERGTGTSVGQAVAAVSTERRIGTGTSVQTLSCRNSRRGAGPAERHFHEDVESTDTGKMPVLPERNCQSPFSGDGRERGERSGMDEAERETMGANAERGMMNDEAPEVTTEVTESAEKATGNDEAPDVTTEATDKVRELVGENERLRAALAETRIEQELVWAAAQQHAINPAQIAHLMRDHVHLDKDLEPTVVDARGDRRTDANGRALTVQDAVRAFLEENAHMVRPMGELTGAGSGGTDATALTGRIPALTGGELIAAALKEGM